MSVDSEMPVETPKELLPGNVMVILPGLDDEGKKQLMETLSSGLQKDDNQGGKNSSSNKDTE